MKPITLAKIVFTDNYNSVLCNLERIKWSLQNTKDVIDCNPGLLDEFENIFEFDKDVDDFDDKINESITLISKQLFILMMSYYEYYLYFLKALILSLDSDQHFTHHLKKLLNSRESISIKKLYKKIEKTIEPNFDSLQNELSEIRNAMIHRDNKIIKDSIVVLISFINENLEVNLDYDKSISLITKVAEFVEEIDQMVIRVFPKLNIINEEMEYSKN